MAEEAPPARAAALLGVARPLLVQLVRALHLEGARRPGSGLPPLPLRELVDRRCPRALFYPLRFYVAPIGKTLTKRTMPMKLATALFTLAVLAALVGGILSVASCSVFRGDNKPPAVMNNIVDCAEKEAAAAAQDIGPLVSAILAGTEWQAGLTELARRHGEAAVACAVAQIASALPKTPAPDDKAAHGRAWLASRPYRLVNAP